MSRVRLLALCLLAAGCGPAEPEVAPTRVSDRARAHVARCDQGLAVHGCDTARRELAEASRRERMAAYRRTFEGEP